MKASEFIQLRLANQQLGNHHHTNIKKLVSYMGAMQAQDFAMSKWAVGSRLKNATIDAVEKAFNKGDILRTHLLRPTWHLVSADDIYWLLELTGPIVKAFIKSRDKQLELTDALYKKTNRIIETLLSKKECSRDEIIDAIKKKKIVVTENRASHFLMRAELDGIICSGKIENNKPNYALLANRAKKKKLFSKEEALHTLATKYFQSHGPAKLSDFTWWSGLTNKMAKEAISSLDKAFIKETFNNETYWLKENRSITKNQSTTILLPAYDEYIISYKDRSQIVDSIAAKKVISSNGIFWPIILINGKVAGRWNRKIVNNQLQLSKDIFIPASSAQKNKLTKAAANYSQFLNKK